MNFMEGLSWGSSKAESQAIYRAFVEAGGNFIDSANTYGNGTSEEYLGEFIASDRDRMVLSTKYTGKYIGSNVPQDANSFGSHRKSMVRSVEASLKRLRTDYIDLLWVHSWDFMTPVEEVIRALDDLVRTGKVLYTGVCNTPAWIVAQANTLATVRGWSPFVALSVEYNLLERDVERELLPMARSLDIGVTAWTPLASGLLTGKYRSNGHAAAGQGFSEPRRLDDPQMSRFAPRTDRNMAIAAEVSDVAQQLGCAPAHVALNWLRSRGVIPMIGARTARHVKENVACFDFPLPDECVARLDAVSKIKLGFPHDFLASGIVRNFLYGGMLEQIDDHRRTLSR